MNIVLLARRQVKFGIVIHRTEEILDYVHTNIWGPIKTSHLEVITTLYHLLMVILGVIGCTPYDTRTKS